MMFYDIFIWVSVFMCNKNKFDINYFDDLLGELNDINIWECSV